jgi:hypothetical protein
MLKKGSKGRSVKELQGFLGLIADGDFGKNTDEAVKEWQSEHGLKPDGIVGRKTMNAMGILSTDISDSDSFTAIEGLEIERYFLPHGEYKDEITKKEYVYLHHTAGWHKPKQVVDSWGRDKRGDVATEFVLGGQSIKGNDETFDGEMIQCFPEGRYAWHLGSVGSRYMHTNSVGIEVCSFGYLTKGGYKKNKKWIPKNPNKFYTYVGTEAHETQVTDLGKEFRGHRYWHTYSENQIEAIRLWILFIAKRDSIDIKKGLVEWIHTHGSFKAFDFNSDAYEGKVKGLLTHTNVRKDKFDMFPQEELVDMLISL